MIKALTLDNGTSIYQWTCWKIVNVIALYKIIKKANNIEKDKIDNKKMEEYYNIFNVISKLEKFIYNQIELIIAKYNYNDKRRFNNFFIKYIDKWGS